MTPTVSTWEELGRRSGNVLLVVNSADGAEAEVGDACDRLAACGDALHVIAPWRWRHWMRARGIGRDRALYARDCDGSEVEINYFLESMPALGWIDARRFALTAGSAPHNLYNEEVKEIFEQRAALFVGRGLFVAHALPQPYLYVFDQPALFARQARYAKVERFKTLSRAIVDDCYRIWREQQSPAVSDGNGPADLSAILNAHLGEAFLEFDEASPIALPREHLARSSADATARFTEVAAHLGEALRERDGVIARLERAPAIRLRRWLRGLVRE